MADEVSVKELSPAEAERRIKALEDKKVQVRFPSETDVSAVISYTSNGTANAEDSAGHSLKRVPQGYLVISVDKAAVIYKGSNAWTTDKIFLKSNTASTAVKLIVF